MMYNHGLNYLLVYKVVEIISTFTSCDISDTCTLMHQ